ncbi:hypothetical protein E4T38_02422 [Aureobasidium subglaciale]|nr:hypothetical protein E4T38_02422 [Aureobasidium subglaciale]KAI5228032.1 hypothetical protein E4T40_02201 [Aureobasidium subglaciale]KAI5231474.1 hypothetical protein E4T41_02421 [Aureobasidium subglaciale]KAI5265477.1 hypothetical protein E4T46_02199 [Aureobasidium subglaciale]
MPLEPYLMLYLHSRMSFDSDETGCKSPVMWIGFTIPVLRAWICPKAHLAQPGFRRTMADKTALFRRVQAVKDTLPRPKQAQEAESN